MTKPHELDRMIRLVREFVAADITDGEIVRRFQSFQVSCIADAANLATYMGQTALVTFVSLVARMGVQIHLAIPNVKLVGPQPLLQRTWLKDALCDFGNNLIPGSMVSSRNTRPSDLLFIFGDTPYVSLRTPSWRLSGTAWEGKISEPQSLGNRWGKGWPIGAMTAAALAAAEVFKAVVRTMKPVQQDMPSPFLEMVREAAWHWGSDCPPSSDLNCGLLDFVSAGAVNQAAMYVLLRVPGIEFGSRVFDDDVIDRTTLNRGMLTLRSDIGRSKVSVIARYANSQAIPERLDGASLSRYIPLAPSVLVGVDDIPARWQVQRATLGWLGVGGTSHFGTLTSSHEAGEPCAGCLHWMDDPMDTPVLPTVSFVSFWAGLALAVRFLRHQIGRPYAMRKQALWLVPLKMDDPNAGWWSPVASRKDCPVRCGTADISKMCVKSVR